jgi:CO/xanthine dehydrogenase FAD-binding subunit
MHGQALDGLDLLSLDIRCQVQTGIDGQPVTPELLTEAGKLAADESQVRDSVRGQAWHRKEMIRVQVRRMGLKCLDMIHQKARQA